MPATDTVEFIVRLILDPKGDGTVPTEHDVSQVVFDGLWETYPVVEVAVEAHERRLPVRPAWIYDPS